MRILITGASGFVGSCLVRRLVKDGYEVHIFTRKESNRWRLADLPGPVTDHQVDLRDVAGVEKAVTRVKPEIIYHLATYGGLSFQNCIQGIFQSNLMGTVNILQACEKVGFNYFVNTGSSSEYGIKSVPMKETDMLEPIGAYGVSKAAATLFCRSEAVEKGLPVVTLRLFSPYGPWDEPNRLIPFVIRSLLRGEAPRLSRPSYVRDYIYIDDVLEAYLNVIKRPSPAGSIYNVGTGRQYSIERVVSMITEIIGKGPAPVWGAVQGAKPEPETWVADINENVCKIGWQPSTDILEGLKKTVWWYRKNLDLYP